MSTELSIANLALGRLGVERISSLSEDSHRAELLNDYLHQSRKDILEQYPWSFAIKRAELDNNGNTPAFEWGFEFEMPADLVRIVSEYNDEEWLEEGDKILANAETLQVRYISNDVSTDRYTPTFKKVWYITLAAELSYSLTQNESLREALLTEAEDVAMGSRSFNSMASSPQHFKINDFTDVRL